MTISFCVLFAVFATTIAGKIPDYIHVCKRNDPNVSDCIRSSIEALRPMLKSGIPELDVPGLEPLELDAIDVSNGHEDDNFHLNLKNVQVTGGSDFQVTKLKLDVAKMIYRVGVKIPVLRFVGDYDLNVRILSLPIRGVGKFDANATDCEGHGILKAKLVGNRLKFTSFDYSLRIGDYNVKLDNLFDGDKTLSEAANQLWNENKEELLPLAIPFVQTKSAEIIIKIANKICDNFDYDDIFPEK